MKGRTLAHYEIIDKLGEGGMGAVWQARDTRLNRIVAIKTLPADKVADAQHKRRFVQEAQTASALNHPNISPFTTSTRIMAPISLSWSWCVARRSTS